MFIADSADAFHDRFSRALHAMLSPDQAGALILVLANSMQADSLRRVLKPAIEDVFSAVRRTLRDNALDITDDDLAVFRALERSGIDRLTSWQTRVKDNWELVFNPMRALRPARSSSEAFGAILRPFDDSAFNFNKPFLRPEILWEGAWGNTGMRVLYNKFPFAPYHLIIVPDPGRRLPQYLAFEYHRMMWQLIEQQQSVLPGLAAGYNSLGACASVNQLHFQGFMREQPLPIELGRWRHRGGTDAYPLGCSAFDSMQASWQQIDELHRMNQPYNLLYRPGRCYLMPRVPQGSDTVLNRVSGAGWIEMSGVFNVSGRAELETVTGAEIEDCLRSLSVSG